MLKLTLVTPEKEIFTDMNVDEVIVPGNRGELNILLGHAPLVTTLSTGTLKYKKGGDPKFMAAVVSWGYCEVCMDKVLVLAETVELQGKIDLPRAQKALKEAQVQLESGDLSPDEIIKFQRKVKRSLERINSLKE